MKNLVLTYTNLTTFKNVKNVTVNNANFAVEALETNYIGFLHIV